ncbi:hypothetical protein [Corynebacterium uterequi]|uniref:Secreted protein n=1 Tax=Corynebacterium uterequi TaxID=1072256 RepID=A0A0G3HFU8_9CORY|nr:hypothetical protein [Corynebacterium uterequi]AKK12164.1 hypothetical protein CUTER_11015 [Corynebacterium uterequi]
MTVRRALAASLITIASGYGLCACTIGDTSAGSGGTGSPTAAATSTVTSTVARPRESTTKTSRETTTASTSAATTSSSRRTIPATAQPTAPTSANDAPLAATSGSCALTDIKADTHPEAPFDTVIYCDGTWAAIGQAHTDYGIYPYWDGSHWTELTPAGETVEGLYGPCYDADSVAKLGPLPDAIHLEICSADELF